jgi:outer membrane protein OmpA-like peptidoglycan-associated protein
MKRIISLLSIFVALSLTVSVYGQVEEELEKQANKKINEGIGKLFGGKKKKKEEKETQSEEAKDQEEDESGEQAANDAGEKKEDVLVWAKYDFVPGDQVIFEDDLLTEENGEFPARWDLERGNVEVAEYNGENVIMFRDNAPSIVPYFKDPQEDYLPDVFTVELDLYHPGDGRFNIYLYDRKNQKSGSPSGYTDVEVSYNQLGFASSASRYPGDDLERARWMHISIAYTNGKLKAYMDDTRLINIPRIDFDPKGITLYTYHARNDNRYYVKNIRIAKGGVKYYDRVMQDGKIIVNGIRFDTGKSTLKPESMGAINEIFNLMKENPDLKFSVEGHTDSQGDDAFNMKLSEDRANTVMNTLVKMGISADRLTAKGWGESKPIANNASPEDMANNRRVEFVKI